MQDNWQEFDRQIGSMLQGAEEQPPRRVWRAVSSRLDEKAAAAVWWKWAVPAFAFAALAVGIFFATGIGNNGPVGGSNLMAVQLQEQASSILMEDLPSPAPIGSTRRAMAPKSTSETQSAPASLASQENPEAASASSDVSIATSEPSSEEPAAQDNNSAFWSQLQQEESTPAARIKFSLSNLYAQGTVGSNDSNISYGGTGISQFAPGSGSEDAQITESGSSTYGIPFSLGLGARFGVLPKLSIGTGVQYSLLTRTFTGSWSGSYTGEIGHNLQYVGIPLNVYYDLLQTSDGLLSLYTWGGGTAEMCVGNSYRMLSGPGTVVQDKIGSMQFSAALGLGFEFRLSGKLGLFVDPAVRYYFHGNAPKSLRTDKPFMFNIDAGLRFNL